MGKLIDLTGQRFGRLTVLERAGSNKGHALWLCQCDCGKTIIAYGNDLMRRQKSCGCIRREKSTKHDGYKMRLYSIWKAMKNRCYRPTFKHYDRYGGRGITVCDAWIHDFAAFQSWALSHGYTDSLTIDRINNDGNYCPDNCRWITMKEQAQNRHPKRTSTTE